MKENQTLMEYLDALVNEAQLNIYEYEEFYENKMLDPRNLAPTDAFLYGIATGKLDMSRNIRDLIQEVMDKHERG